ncbi:MAG: redoxin domain-containing protein [Ignavibacteria bacterium]|nr:redoxin domain-containing protein [Ignavibacteria bacterium]
MDVKDYTLRDRDGKDVKLSEMFGEKDHLILIHNMGKGCPYCTMWADGFKDTYKEIEKKASFVLVSPDKPEVHKEFAEAHGWNYRSYSANGTDFILTWDMISLRTVSIITGREFPFFIRMRMEILKELQRFFRSGRFLL